MAAVADKKGEVRLFQRLPGAVHSHGLHGIGGLSDARGIDKPQPGGTCQYRLLHRIPGSAGNIGNNGPVKARQSVQQAGFAHVGPANNGGLHALPQNAALAVGLQKRVKGLGVTPQGRGVVGKAEVLNVLVRVIQNGVEMAAQIRQAVIYRQQYLLQSAPYLPRGVGGGVGGLRLDQIDDCLRLGQIQFTIQKGPLRKFSPAGRSGPGGIETLQSRRQHGRRSVTVKLHGVLAGIAVGRPGNHGHTLVNGPALDIKQFPQNQLPVRDALQRAGKDLFRNFNTVVSRQPQNADGGHLISRGDGSNGM